MLPVASAKTNNAATRYGKRRLSAQGFAGFSVSVSIYIAVPLAQQLLRAGIGADLAAAVTAAAWCCAIWDDCRATSLAEIPGSGDAARHLPHPVSAPAGTVFRVQILLGIAAAQVLPIRECLTVLHQRQVDVDVRDHLGNRTAVAIGGFDLEPDLVPDREPLLQVAASLLAVRSPRGWPDEPGWYRHRQSRARWCSSLAAEPGLLALPANPGPVPR